jgi:hypothetical protein
MRIQSAHSRVLAQLIAEHRAKILDAVAQGVKRKLYLQLVGQLQGLDDALRLSIEADSKLNGDSIVDR